MRLPGASLEVASLLIDAVNKYLSATFIFSRPKYDSNLYSGLSVKNVGTELGKVSVFPLWLKPAKL